MKQHLMRAAIRSACATFATTAMFVVGPGLGTALASTTTTIGFDDLAPGTAVSTQYGAQGVNFAQGILATNVYCYPVVESVAAGQAQSGSQVADTSCANGEFPDSAIYGSLTNSADAVSVYAGFTPVGSGYPPSQPVTLTAYDILGNVVSATTVSVPQNQGTHTLLSVSSSSPNIVAFDVTAANPYVSIDDLTFDNPGGVPADFTISPKSTSVQLTQGATINDTVTIQRLNGSFGGVTFSASGVPTGVQVSFSPNPATGTSTTMTVTASPNAALPPPGPFPSFTVTATPANSGVGPTSRSASISVAVEALFAIGVPPSVGVPPCSTLHVPVTVTPSVFAPPGFSGTVSLSASGLPPDDQVSFSPATLSLPGQTQSIMTVTSQSDVSGPLGNVTVTATGGGVADTSVSFPVSRVGPSITSLTDSSGAQRLQGGQTPQGASPDLGTVVIVHGQGFCPGSTVFFGNARASAVSQGPFTDGLGPFGDETAIRTSVPSLATSGQVYVVRPGDSLSSPGTAAAPFTVDSYRDVNAFAFDNSSAFQSAVGGYSFSDVSAVFGDAATHVSVNPCWPFGTCTVVTPIPDPFALLFWGIADAALQQGQCFGFSLASQRLLHGDQSFAAFPSQPGSSQTTVWNVQGPDGAGGPSPEISHFIHLMHLEQFSAEALHFWWTTAVANAISGSQASLIHDVTSALSAGDHPLIELRNGSEGHVVVAYGVDQPNGSGVFGSGDQVIDVYDPNQEFLTGENATDGAAHLRTMSTSVIVIHSDGHWEFQGFSPEWHGGPGSLVVMPYGVVPLQPTLPTSISGLVTLLFGSARATQVTDSAGHTLLNSDGSLNTNPATRIAGATQFATMSGSAKPGPAIFLFGRPGAYTTTVQGSATGVYHDALFAHGVAASISAAATPAIKDRISMPAGTAGLQFGQAGAGSTAGGRAANVQVVVTGTQGSERTATVATSVPVKGQAGVMFTSGHDTVEVTAGNQSMSYRLSLSWSGPHGLPQTFVAPTVHLEAGDRATLTPGNWSALQSSSVMLHVRHRNGGTTTRILANTVHPSGSYTLALQVRTVGATRRLTIAARFARLAPGSTALLTWEVFKGRTLVARHAVVLAGRRLHRGLVSQTFVFRGRKAARYTLRASAQLLSPTRAGTYLSQQVSRTRRL